MKRRMGEEILTEPKKLDTQVKEFKEYYLTPPLPKFVPIFLITQWEFETAQCKDGARSYENGRENRRETDEEIAKIDKNSRKATEKSRKSRKIDENSQKSTKIAKKNESAGGYDINIFKNKVDFLVQ